ncbi:MAG: Na/Pi symporter, partial [Sulfurimonadaceae bacterium]|nr:Na/Pi symporter [Sulfurimonadaceae bacterium]
MDYAAAAQGIGGLGLFLLGLIVMTDGLRSIAGDAVRAALLRYTRSPYSGAMTGAAGTALMQSSSATTVAAVGFVGAGLMHFSEALGIIFGANLGTTVTGWLVLLFGFKLKLGLLALPLVFIGAVMRLFAKGKWGGIGFAIAGFGLLFVGIAMLQEGMGALQGLISFEQFPADTWSGRLQLLALGMIFTVITQSSSAGVAAALTAMFAGLISFEQAAALVIGMDIGTTVKVAVITVGSNSEVRRTGYSHLIYNLFTGALA